MFMSAFIYFTNKIIAYIISRNSSLFPQRANKGGSWPTMGALKHVNLNSMHDDRHHLIACSQH